MSPPSKMEHFDPSEIRTAALTELPYRGWTLTTDSIDTILKKLLEAEPLPMNVT
jgi:hypothetical protein